MALSISLPFLLAYALLVSAILSALNKRGASTGLAAAAAAGTCLLPVLEVCVTTSGPVVAARQQLLFWLLFICLPTGVVVAVSRVGMMRNRPWGLLVVGPLSFLLSLVLITMGWNILFAPDRLG